MDLIHSMTQIVLAGLFGMLFHKDVVYLAPGSGGARVQGPAASSGAGLLLAESSGHVELAMANDRE